MKYGVANLTANVVSSYDKTKTTLFGRDSVKTVNGVTVIGAPLSKFIDTFTDAALVPGSSSYCSPNGRLFIPTSITGGVMTIALYNANLGAGADVGRFQYIGKLNISFPNLASTTHAIKFLKVFDGTSSATTTGWKIMVGTTGTITENTGVFLANNIGFADFNISPATVFFAVANNAKGVYSLQDPAAVGISQSITSLMGSGLDRTAMVLYTTNGTAASMNVMGFDVSANPNVISYTVTPPTTGATWTLNGHGFLANDMFVLSSTGALPTGFTATTGVAAPTVYWVSATNLTANTFELKASKAGGSVSATAAGSGVVTATRAWGTSTNMFLPAKKTGTIVTGFTGTALTTDNQGLSTINDTASPNNGQLTMFFPTTTSFYNFRVSEITAGTTALTTINGVNNAGTGLDILAPTTLFAVSADGIGQIVYAAATFSFQTKRWINSQITGTFGGQTNAVLENSGQPTNFFGMSAIIGLEERNGWLFAASATVGQRGIFAVDMYSDYKFGNSYFTTPVLDLGSSARLMTVGSLEQLFNITDGTEFAFRSATTAADAVFNSPGGSWTTVSDGADLSANTVGRYIQFQIAHDIITLLSSTPSQIQEIHFGYAPTVEISDYWEGAVDNTTVAGATPSYTAFRLWRTYPTGSVPQMFFRGYDDANNTVASGDTVSNPTYFTYSTDNGVSWQALGTIPNTAGTLLRFVWASPPGVNVHCTLRES